MNHRPDRTTMLRLKRLFPMMEVMDLAESSDEEIWRVLEKHAFKGYISIPGMRRDEILSSLYKRPKAPKTANGEFRSIPQLRQWSVGEIMKGCPMISREKLLKIHKLLEPGKEIPKHWNDENVFMEVERCAYESHVTFPGIRSDEYLADEFMRKSEVLQGKINEIL